VRFVARTAVWIPAGVIGLLTLPLWITSRTFGDDWTLHLWLVRQQEMNIQANGRPGLFLSARPLGAFYPIFAFVGSGMYSVGGYLSIALGGRPILAYKLLYLFALCLAYGGMTWLSWIIGLRRWRSQIPGLVLITGAYFVTDMYGRGDLAETMALSAIPFLIAAITAVATSPRTKPQHLLAVVIGVFVLTGSHNITLLYGTIFLAFLTLITIAAYTPTRPAHLEQLTQLHWKRIPALTTAAAIGTGLNAWYLLTDLKYGLTTTVAKRDALRLPSTGLSQWKLLLNPFRPADGAYTGTSHDVRVSLPWLFALWALVIAVIAWRRIDSVSRKMIILLTALAAAYLTLIVDHRPWHSLPHFLYNIQFTLRLNAYVLLATALLVMIALLHQARENENTRRTTSTALTLITLFTITAATWQAWTVPSTYHTVADGNQFETPAPRNFADTVIGSQFVVSPSWYEGGQFRDVAGPVLPLDLGFSHDTTVPEFEVKGSNFGGPLDVRIGPLPFRTNIAGWPFVTITGITPIGITPSGFLVAVRNPGIRIGGPVDVTIRQASTRLLRGGALVSKLSLFALAALLAWTILALLVALWPRITANLQPIS
jgi:hypothetical protein